MRTIALASVFSTLLVAVIPAQAADEMNIERLATCQDSWLDWKNDPPRMRKFGDSFQSAFMQKAGDPFFVPKTSTTVVGLPVAQVFPESVGMAMGFSVLVDANFDKTKRSIEKKIGKTFKKCETGDNMRHCELPIGEKKTILLMAEDNPKSKTTLFGCYYFYEK